MNNAANHRDSARIGLGRSSTNERVAILQASVGNPEPCLLVRLWDPEIDLQPLPPTAAVKQSTSSPLTSPRRCFHPDNWQTEAKAWRPQRATVASSGTCRVDALGCIHHEIENHFRRTPVVNARLRHRFSLQPQCNAGSGRVCGTISTGIDGTGGVLWRVHSSTMELIGPCRRPNAAPYLVVAKKDGPYDGDLAR